MKLTILRVSLASVLLAAAGTSLAPHMTSYVSTVAAVNAPLVSVSAPFNGVIEKASSRVAVPVATEDRLFVLKNMRSQRSELQSLEAELGAISGEIAGIANQVNDLNSLKGALVERREAKLSARRSWFVAKLDEARWDIAKAEANLERAVETQERNEALSKSGNVRGADIVDARAELATARADVARRQATYRRLEIEESTLDGALGVDMTSDDFEQTEYRIDEISIRLSDLDARLLGLQTRRAALKTQISRVSLESTRQEVFSPKSPVSGLVWNATGLEGSNISGGERLVEILDCSRRFLEVVLPERHFEKVPAGTKAWVKLKGSSEGFSAEVLASYGSGALPNRTMQAASPRIAVNGGVRVIVGRIGEADLSSHTVQRSFCDVGRAAEVRFDVNEGIVEKAAARLAEWFGTSLLIDSAQGETKTESVNDQG